MTTTIEISLYPLQKEYPSSVLIFLRQLKTIPGIDLQSNGMSTIIIGEFETIWARLGKLMSAQFDSEESVFVLKVAVGRKEFLEE